MLKESSTATLQLFQSEKLNPKENEKAGGKYLL